MPHREGLARPLKRARTIAAAVVAHDAPNLDAMLGKPGDGAG
jgi:hypothetical protein